jgi:hypothetical protein
VSSFACGDVQKTTSTDALQSTIGTSAMIALSMNRRAEYHIELFYSFVSRPRFRLPLAGGRPRRAYIQACPQLPELLHA